MIPVVENELIFVHLDLLYAILSTNKKPANLVGLGQTPRHSTLQSRQIFSQVHCVTTGNLASYHDRILRLYAGCTRLHTLMQYIGA